LFHYGGQLAAPVFKEVATKLYAMYVQGKKTKEIPFIIDSTDYRFAGFTQDVRTVLEQINLKPVDSANKNGWATLANNQYKMVLKNIPVEKNKVPDVRNKTLKDALYELENLDMKVIVKGRGKIVAQDVLPGTPLRKNQIITLLLN
jgi:cell division protein FtsI (penicillin-binding protein 3)